MSDTQTKSLGKFSAWIEARNDMASEANAAVVDKVLAKLQEQKAAKLEVRALAVFHATEAATTRLRDIRKQEKAQQETLRKLNALGDSLLAGTVEDDVFTDMDDAVVRYGSPAHSTVSAYVEDVVRKLK